MSRLRARILVACASLWLAAGIPAGAVAAPGNALAAPADRNCAEPGEQIARIPWSQQMLAPERVWPFTRGGGMVVAVLDSGVDASHPQLGGEVSAGFDALAGRGRADTDCRGTGTQVAGVIAAWQTRSVGFVGLAPNVVILPVRVIADQGSGEPQAQATTLARGIRFALDSKADVIAVPVVSYTDDAALRAAVADAVRAEVVVVAAAGDLGDAEGGGPTPYPAAYDGVIGVGAIGQTGAHWPKSQAGPYVDLVAPGADVVTLQRGRGMTVASGTGIACGFVAATAALTRANRGRLAGDEVARLLRATAVPAPAGPVYGHGIVNPYAAVNDQLAEQAPAPLPALSPPTQGQPSAWLRSRDVAMAGAGLAGLATVVVLAVAIVLPRGRRGWWRAAVAPSPASRAEPEEPGPPVTLFDEPA
ncbi:MAG TPA: S8 family serine peptidase [Pilimelia sp.]|nr:S8 family serine peptidase [Pilimelia sp.]